MADDALLALLGEGVDAWNKWRVDNPNEQPDLRKAPLAGSVFLRHEPIQRHRSGRLVLMPGLDLSSADLTGADLRGAQFFYADFRHAELSSVAASGAAFYRCDFQRAAILDADFSNSTLDDVKFVSTYPFSLNMTGAKIRDLVLSNTDLSQVHGLDSVTHAGPSYISVDTLYRSARSISVDFLLGCGVDSHLIEYLPALASQTPPMSFYSSFISYSSQDQLFAAKLYTDLKRDAVRCWLATEDMKIGAPLRHAIDTSIHVHDKVILLLSASSIRSQWVEQEVETALAKERAYGSMTLFPIRLDDAIMHADVGWPALLRNTRNIGDFSRWCEPQAYQAAYNRLLAALRREKAA